MKRFQYIMMFIGIGLLGCEQAQQPDDRRSTEAASKDTGSSGNGGGGQSTSDDVVAGSLKDQSLGILEANCSSCHNPETAEGGFGGVLNVEAMIESGRIIPGNGEASPLIRKLAPIGNMPPSGALDLSDRDILVAWIDQIAVSGFKFLSDADHIREIRSDMQLVPTAQRPTTRYFSMQVPNNTGMDEQVRSVMGQALAKTINSLSRAAALVIPVPVGADGLIYRVNLQDLAIDPNTFDDVIRDFYPFARAYLPFGNDPILQRLSDDHQFLVNEAETENYVIRADWFVATATLPILYQQLLNLPNTLQGLETQLGVSRQQNILNDQVLRAGFKNSGVTIQNRVIERHASGLTNLPYWISYDFASNDVANQNVFNFPIGPVGSGFNNKAFDHDAGEVIFQLPNGLLGFYLAQANGANIDKSSVSIAQQANGPAQFIQSVVNGVACMSCHHQGLIFKSDEIRGFAGISQDFSDAEKEKIFNIYASDQQLQNQIDADNLKYQTALSTLGMNPSDQDPVTAVYQFYNRKLKRSEVIAELGVDEITFNTVLASEPFKSAWVSLYQPAGEISREEFNFLATSATNVFRSAVSAEPPILGDHLVTAECMVANATQMDICTSDVVP